ncbi:hypothetical protein HUE58_00095 [Candidatus Ruthia endofausta]|uniref:Uncharacterized protein n=1 Tax=Candidatus Ruthia endofausta TaxID=2738852 RepID=A0A6N0HMT5_9GAMM|nr:hypothetical protein [Candidatus Ruthia endofausta]QKQ23642.1 hypothetical protein HUE58_00095 [Candidatus Ruthia endofausta]
MGYNLCSILCYFRHFQETRNTLYYLIQATGSGYPSGFNMGDAVVILYLRSKQIQYLDKIIISSGCKNRFNHPAKIVLDRYKNHNINILNTNYAGQIKIFLNKDITINQYRQDYTHYYQCQCN